MAAKKTFTDKINSTSSVFDSIATATADESTRKPRKGYTEEEAAEALENLQTSGKKGVKLPRLNVAFTPSNMQYLRTMAAARGESFTAFINAIVKEHAEKNGDLYQEARAFIEKVDQRKG